MFSFIPPVPVGQIKVKASDVETDTANFNGILNADDTDVQKVLDKIDDLTVDGGEYGAT